MAIIAAGAVQLKKAVTRDFVENLDLQSSSSVSRRVEWLGVAGYAARGVVFALVGWFLLQAAIDHQPDDAVGIDGALKRLVVEPYGPFLLILVAVGVIAFGCWSWSRPVTDVPAADGTRHDQEARRRWELVERADSVITSPAVVLDPAKVPASIRSMTSMVRNSRHRPAAAR